MKEELSIDFETRSETNLRFSGVYRYVEDPSTDIWVVGYAFGDEDTSLWVPGDPIPQRIIDHVGRVGIIRAWNATFERILWRSVLGPKHGWPVPGLEQYIDTAAEAAAMALPRKLSNAAHVLSVPHQVDPGKNRLVLRMSRPRNPTKTNPAKWWDSPQRIAALHEAVQQDVRMERDVARVVRRLSPAEQRRYWLDQRINDRGLGIDTALSAGASKIVAEGQAEADVQMSAVTGGAVTAVSQTAALREFTGMASVAKDKVRDALTQTEMEWAVFEALSIRASAGRTSLAKLDAISRIITRDGRLHGLLMFLGAGTGRWSGKFFQPQNLPRGEVKDVEHYIPHVLRGDLQHLLENLREGDGAIDVVVGLLRSMVVPAPNRRFAGADYEQIEARVLAWLAEQDDLVDLFASGGLVYEDMAAFIYNMNIADVENPSEERTVGKGAILGCGFQMWWPKFQAQVKKQTGIDLSDADAEKAVKGYREKFPKIRQFWPMLQHAAVRAMRKPGSVVHTGRDGRIRYTYRGGHLWAILPSGRTLTYPNAKLKQIERFGKKLITFSYETAHAETKQWITKDAYGGLLTENIVQATARDIMVEAMERLEQTRYPIVLTVHDEILTEPRKAHGSIEEMTQIMEVIPTWAPGMPVKVKAWEGERYKK